MPGLAQVSDSDCGTVWRKTCSALYSPLLSLDDPVRLPSRLLAHLFPTPLVVRVTDALPVILILKQLLSEDFGMKQDRRRVLGDLRHPFPEAELDLRTRLAPNCRRSSATPEQASEGRDLRGVLASRRRTIQLIQPLDAGVAMNNLWSNLVIRETRQHPGHKGE